MTGFFLTMKIHYQISLEDGTLAESSFDGEPIDYHLDEPLFPPQINQLLNYLEAGSELQHWLDAEDGWGKRNPDNIHSLPKSDFAAWNDLQEGMILEFTLPNGDTLPGAIIEIGDENIKVDFNHPFAGQRLLFKIRRLE